MPTGTVFVVDDDPGFRDSVEVLCRSVGLETHGFAEAEEMLGAYADDWRGVLVLDVRMPRMSGLEVQQELERRGSRLPILFVTAHGDIEMAVTAMKRGASDFLTKPVRPQDLLDRVHAVLRAADEDRRSERERSRAVADYDQLTPRERQVFGLVTQGDANKVIANRMGISERTVELHRSNVMRKMRADSLADLVRRALLVEEAMTDESRPPDPSG